MVIRTRVRSIGFRMRMKLNQKLQEVRPEFHTVNSTKIENANMEFIHVFPFGGQEVSH